MNGSLLAGLDALAATLADRSPIDMHMAMTKEGYDSEHVVGASAHALPAGQAA